MRKSFTLVEIMICVGIIAALSALAIPNLLRARLNVNETAAILNMKNLFEAAQAYWALMNRLPKSIQNLQTESNPPYIRLCDTLQPDKFGSIDWDKGPCINHGYEYKVYGTGSAGDFWIHAIPISPGTTGNRRFCLPIDGTIRQNGENFSDYADCCAGTQL